MFSPRLFLVGIGSIVALLAAPSISSAGFTVKLEVSTSSTFATTTGTALVHDNNSPANTTTGSTANVATADRDTDIGVIATRLVNIPGSGTDVLPLTVGGIRFGLTTSIGENDEQARISSTSNIVVRNTNTAERFVRITIQYDGFVLPGDVGSKLVLDNMMTIIAFYNSLGNVFDGGGNYVLAYSLAKEDLAITSQVGGTTPGGYQSDVDFNRTSTPYTMAQVITIRLGGRTSAQFQARATLINPVPAPSGLIMLAGAVPFFGLLRRRLRKGEPTTAA